MYIVDTEINFSYYPNWFIFFLPLITVENERSTVVLSVCYDQN